MQWHFQRQAAVRAVRDLTGVKGVLSEIRITPRPVSKDVKERVGAALRRRAQIDADGMSVEVEGGRVTLKGSVASLAEKQLAERAVWAAPGVTAVSNQLAVDYRAALAL